MFSRFGRRCLSVVAWFLFSVGFTDLLLQLGNSSSEAILSIVMPWVLVTVFGYAGTLRPPNTCLQELLRYCSGIAVLFFGWGSNNIGEVVSVKSCFLHVWHTFRSFLMLLLFAFFMQSRSDNDEFSSVFARCCYVLGDCSDGCVVDSFCIVCIHQAGLIGQSFVYWSFGRPVPLGFVQPGTSHLFQLLEISLIVVISMFYSSNWLAFHCMFLILVWTQREANSQTRRRLDRGMFGSLSPTASACYSIVPMALWCGKACWQLLYCVRSLSVCGIYPLDVFISCEDS